VFRKGRIDISSGAYVESGELSVRVENSRM